MSLPTRRESMTEVPLRRIFRRRGTLRSVFHSFSGSSRPMVILLTLIVLGLVTAGLIAAGFAAVARGAKATPAPKSQAARQALDQLQQLAGSISAEMGE